MSGYISNLLFILKVFHANIKNKIQVESLKNYYKEGKLQADLKYSKKKIY